MATCRKFAPTARNYTASKLMWQVGLRVSEACKLDLADIKWKLVCQPPVYPAMGIPALPVATFSHC